MAYGRLEVYYPDGRFETHLLESDQVSVGRAEGNAVPLDSDTISRYHFSISRDSDNVFVTDLESANGTYVDGSQIAPEQAVPLGDVEEIQVGSLRIIFRKVDEQPTVPVNTQEDDETIPIARPEAGIRLSLDQTSLRVWPAASASSELEITNTSETTRKFQVRVSGMPSEWLRVTRPELEVRPGRTAYVLINIKPPRRAATEPRKYEAMVEVVPMDLADPGITAVIDVTIEAFSGFGIAIARHVEAGDPATVFLHNQGSAPLTIHLAAQDRHNALEFSLPTRPITLAAGQRSRVDIQIRGKSPAWVGSNQEHTFVVQARADNASGFMAVAEGKTIIPPRLPVWGAVSAAGIIVSGFIILSLVLLRFLNPADPRIEDVRVETNRIARGDELVVSLNPENVNTLRVLVNSTLLDEFEGDTEQFRIDTDDYDGTIVIDIIGERGNTTTSAQVTSFVYEPVEVAAFTIEPPQLVRNVVSTLELSWDIPGATYVRIEGLSDFTNELLQPSTEYSPQYTLEGVGGIPTEPLEVVLIAEDEVGNVIREVRTVEILDPQCTALEDIVVREGPDERYQQVASIPTNATVVVTAQDADAGWLRVRLQGEVRGWAPRNQLICATTFDPSNLRTEINVPTLPTLVPERTPESTEPPA